MRGRPRPIRASPAAIAIAVGLIGVVFLIAYELGFGSRGLGLGHVLAGLVLFVGCAVVGLFKGGRK